MALSKKPRHWASLALAVVVTGLAVGEALDFAPGWMERHASSGVGLLSTLLVIVLVLNLVLDGRESGRDDDTSQ